VARRVNTAAQTVADLISYARSDAVISKTDITVCAYDNADDDCLDTADWSGGIKLVRGKFKVHRSTDEPQPPTPVTNNQIDPPKIPEKFSPKIEKPTQIAYNDVLIKCNGMVNGRLVKNWMPPYDRPYYEDLATFLDIVSAKDYYEALDMYNIDARTVRYPTGIQVIDAMLEQIEKADEMLAVHVKRANEYLAERQQFVDDMTACEEQFWTTIAAHEVASNKRKFYDWLDNVLSQSRRLENDLIAIQRFLVPGRKNEIRQYEQEYNNYYDAKNNYKKQQEAYDKDLKKYYEDLEEWKKQPKITGFEILNQQLVLANNKLGKDIKIISTSNMLITNNMIVSEYNSIANELNPISNTKILVSDKQNKNVKTICVNVLGTTQIKIGDQDCT